MRNCLTVPTCYRVFGGLLAAMLLFTGMALPLSAAEKPVVFADFSWESAQLHNRIAGYLLEKGFGCDTDYVFVEEIPGFMGLERGDLQITMEAWVDNSPEYWKDAWKREKVLSLGKNFPDAPQGWYVPTYMIKGDPERGIDPVAPDLRSVADLAKYAQLFSDPEDPEKGRFLNGPTGWVICSINEKKLESYGLDETFNNFFSGSGSALAVGIVEAYRKGKPVVAYYWEPTPLLGMYDMTKLEEPPYDKEIWDTTAACAFPSCRVFKVANAEFLEKNPAIKAFLERYATTLELTNNALGYIKKNELDLKDGAKWFLREHPDLWKGWIGDPEREARIEKALQS